MADRQIPQRVGQLLAAIVQPDGPHKVREQVGKMSTLILALPTPKHVIKLEFHTASMVSLTWEGPGPEDKVEFFETYAFGLRRFANIIEGKVSYEDFSRNTAQTV